MAALEKSFRIKGLAPRYPIVQGGMGVGISLRRLAAAVSRRACIGTVSSAGLYRLLSRRWPERKPFGHVEATAREIGDTKDDAGFCAINIMVALQSAYEESVVGAVEGGVDVIISGAGLPMNLPSIVQRACGKRDHEVALVPIVSSARAFELICRRWEKQGYRPDAVVLEGPKAGGHLGWTYKQIQEAKGEFVRAYDLLDVLLPPVLDVAEKYPNDAGPIPVIVAGGIYDHGDIVDALKRGASAVQMGTRFAVTKESDGSALFKQLLIDAKKEDIVIASERWGSPCGLPFRYVRRSPLAQRPRPPEQRHFCICTTLLGAAGIDDTHLLGKRGGLAKNCPEGMVRRGNAQCPAHGYANYAPLVTCGTEAYRVDRVVPTGELIAELVGAHVPISSAAATDTN